MSQRSSGHLLKTQADSFNFWGESWRIFHQTQMKVYGHSIRHLKMWEFLRHPTIAVYFFCGMVRESLFFLWVNFLIISWKDGGKKRWIYVLHISIFYEITSRKSGDFLTMPPLVCPNFLGRILSPCYHQYPS